MSEFKIKVLFVDDEDSNLRIFKATFKRFYQIYTASSGQEGLNILAEQEINLIITDQKMPKMTGVEFLERAVQIRPETPRIMLTAYSDMEAIVSAINNVGIYRYISKPWENDALKNTIDASVETFILKQENKELIASLKRANEELEQKVEKRTEELQQKNRQILDSIRYAKYIQYAILPDLKLLKQIIPESFVIFLPKDIVSGDFYWFHEEGDKIIIAAGDCTGHGVPGAFMSLIGCDTLNLIVKVQKNVESDQILIELNKLIRKNLRQNGKSIQDGMDIALCVIDKKERKIDFSGAKNPMLFINSNLVCEYLRADRFSVGGFQKNSEKIFSKHSLFFEENTNFYLFSDGFYDQFGGEFRKRMSSKHFYQLIQENCQKPMEEQKKLLLESFYAWKNQHDQLDDVLVIGFRL